MRFLYEEFEGGFARAALNATEVPQVIVSNLKHRIRPYQTEAFKRFLLWQEKYADNYPPHLLFNMATGSGKTLIMAGLILLAYHQGHRNFLFFVDKSNIIRKTKDNFLTTATSKYLFTQSISIDGKQVSVKEVDSFADADEHSINIKFTTIHKLHNDLNTHKENGVTLEDFAEQKMILLADEAHHLNAATKKQKNLLETWESTVQEILKTNSGNLLLEFTATTDYNNPAIAKEYENKIIYRYDLRQFREDKYSKEINLFKSHYDEKERIIQALILNVYRQELATVHGINLKPVILFKAQKTVAQSAQNKENFHQIIEQFSTVDVKNIKQTATAPIIKKAFAFFKTMKLTDAGIAKRIQERFQPEHCISANNEQEKHENQTRLNTLEDDDNPLRAVFAVQKLNEGWDVLNLFDIVRLYETRDARNNQPGKTTIAEAQLIGRGARYFPFSTSETQEKFKRKFDNDVDNDLKVLEELYYHTRDDNNYIYELKRALEESGIYEDDRDTTQMNLFLKPKFTKTKVYQQGKVFFNQKTYPERHENIRASGINFSELKSVDHKHNLASGVGSITHGLGFELEAQDQTAHILPKRVPINSIEKNVIKAALSSNPFFRFDNLCKCFGVNSVSQFITSKNYLSGVSITFKATKERLDNITQSDHYDALKRLLANIEKEIKSGTPEFRVSDWVSEYTHKIFTDKQVRVKNAYVKGQNIARNAEWYAYNDNYGTPEEEGFVEFFAGNNDAINKNYDNVYLLRNERQLKIFNKKGRRFEPDFVLFLQPKSGEKITYQIFIEPKGDGFIVGDKWKEKFLDAIAKEKKVIKIETVKYKILGLPFFNREGKQNKKFNDAFIQLLELKNNQDTLPK